MGRSFFSPEGGLYMSLLINERLPAHMSLGITTAAAVAVARAIDKIAGGRSKIKWVNDVYRNGKKVCGILTEAKADCDGFLKWAVLGIGVNLTAPDGGFPEEIAMRAGAVFDEISDDCDNRLCAAIVDEFMDMYRKGLSPSLYLDEYRDRSNVIGQRIDVMRIHDGEAVPATVTFALLVMFSALIPLVERTANAAPLVSMRLISPLMLRFLTSPEKSLNIGADTVTVWPLPSRTPQKGSAYVAGRVMSAAR